MKILIAEDERVSARRLEVVLTSWGYDVVVAHDGLSAWKLLQQPDAPNLAILDWIMPGMDGVQLCREIRLARHEPYTFVLLLTEKRSREDVIEGMNAGADDYLTKPFDAKELEVRLSAGRRVLKLMQDSMAMREALREQATHDSLTGLLNRRGVHDSLARELSRAGRTGSSLGVILTDLDHFKQINDTYGHMAGDCVLQETARRVRSKLRPYDSIGRVGGEEFLIVIPGCSPQDVYHKADALRGFIGNSPIGTADGSIVVTASMGAAVTDGETLVTADELIKAADVALYKAKNSGRNRVELAPGLTCATV